MKKNTVYFLFALLFSCMTIAGSLFVILSGGIQSPWYSFVPMCAGVFFLQLWHNGKDSKPAKKQFSMIDFLISIITVVGTTFFVLSGYIQKPIFFIIPVIVGATILVLWHNRRNLNANKNDS